MKRVLVVDDEEDMLWMLQRNLNKGMEDVEILAAKSGEEALAILSDKSVVLVITDINMPGMSGLDLLIEITNKFPKTGVIIMTAYPSNAYENKAMMSGSLRFIEKPFDIKEVREIVREVLNESEGFQGTVDGVDLVDIVQFNGLSRATAALKVTTGETEGMIFFKDGTVVHAMCDKESGEKAFFTILGFNGGSLQNIKGVEAPIVSINKSIEALLFEAAVKSDEDGEQKDIGLGGELPTIPSGGAVAENSDMALSPTGDETEEIELPLEQSAESVQDSEPEQNAEPKQDPEPEQDTEIAQDAELEQNTEPEHDTDPEQEIEPELETGPEQDTVLKQNTQLEQDTEFKREEDDFEQDTELEQDTYYDVTNIDNIEDDQLPISAEDFEMTEIQKILAEFTNIEGVHTACLVGRDGFLLDSLARSGIDAEMIGAIASSGFGSAESMGTQLGQGNLSMTMFEFENGPVMFAPVGDDAFLVIVADQETNLGWIRISIKKNSAKIRKAAAL